MGYFRYTQVLILLVLATTLAVGMANKNVTTKKTQHWNWGFNYTDWASKHLNYTQASKRIIVGGSDKWHYGFNYSDWALKNGPFYFNDTLVFKYDPPNSTTFPHSVYLLPNLWSFLMCDLRRARRLAGPTQGGQKGFEFVLNKWQPYYFACGERNGLHCKAGLMRFFVLPLFHP